MAKPVILCVDDEKVVLNGLKAQLKRHLDNAFSIETAETGEEAIEILTELHSAGAEFPLVISDQIMPGMKGDEVLAHVYKTMPQTRTILLTGQADVDAIGRAVNHARLYRYIAKPWDETDLNLTVSEAVRSFLQDKTIENQNNELVELVTRLRHYNETLEEKVRERTIEVTQQKEVIEQKNKSITDSIQYAKGIQEAVLPADEKISLLLPDSFVFYRPRDIVSGDFYWITQIDDLIVLAAVDCTGHGVPGAFMSMLGVTLLNETVVKKGITQPAAILNHLRDNVVVALNQEGRSIEKRDGMDIALCVIDVKNGLLQYAGAYNPLYLFRKANNYTLEHIQADRMPVGMHFKEHQSFKNHVFEYQKGDMFYIFSDGYIDQFGGKDARKFLSNGFRQLLINIHHLPVEEQHKRLVENMDAWLQPSPNQQYEQVDDMLVWGVRL